MPAPHRIRLLGPWDVVAGNTRGRLTIPTTFRAGEFPAALAVSLYRRFGQPTNLSRTETVWLLFEGLTGTANVTLNGTPMGTVHGSGGFVITPWLQARNLLEVTFPNATLDDGLTGEVCLEIRNV